MEIVFTRAEARAYDRHCMDTLGIPGLVLMERAARGCADRALEMLAHPASRVLVVCGAGQNGGDGYAVARMLAEQGHRVEIRSFGEPKSGTDAGEMRRRAVAAGVCVRGFDAGERVEGVELMVDALFGTGLDRPVEGGALRVIAWMNVSGVPILSIDIPSGLDCDSGRPSPESVRATRTATMVATKRGFREHGAGEFVGRVDVVSIGGPVPVAFSRSGGPG